MWSEDGSELRDDYGRAFGGPPWILGHRGTPREVPENTLAGMRRAFELGLDGFEYDLRACATGEAVLIHDARLERTTDAEGPVIARTLPELFGIDAGSWFSRKYRGEPLPLFDEVLEIAGDDARGWPLHMIEIKERGLARGVATKLRTLAPQLDVRVASFLRDVVLEVRDLGLPGMLLAERATEDDRVFVRDEHLTAYSTGPGGWRGEVGRRDFSSCERWSWAVDDPRDLLEACRLPLAGFNTNEPYRALATRALVRLAPDDDGPYPVQPPWLPIEPEALDADVRARGEWYGSWRMSAHVRNPFPFAVEAACGAFFRSGAFEVGGLPRTVALEPGEEREIPFELTGGARSPGGDPLFAAHFRWPASFARAAGGLLLDAPMPRVRRIHVDAIAQRLPLLVERPGDASASMTVRRAGNLLFVAIENPGGLEQAHTIVHLDGETVRGGRGLRLELPADFDVRSTGTPFSCGIEGRRGGEPVVRRWAGGLPEGLGHGAPGALLAGD